MSKIVLDTIASGYNLAKINDNFTKIAATLNNEVLYRDVPDGETNTVKNDIDMDSNDLLNVGDLRVLGTASIDGINFDAVNSALVWRGVWNSSTSYAVSDAVSYNGSSYISIASNINSAPPSSSWNILAQQGTSGAGTGDVTGPPSSTSGAIVVFASGTGKALSDSGILPSTLAVKGDIASSGITGAAHSGTNSDITSLTALINGIVGTSGDQTIDDIKTFLEQPVLPHAPFLETPYTTSGGSAYGYTTIPSWVNEIDVLVSGVSTAGSFNVGIQIGSGGYATSGYDGTTSQINGSTPSTANLTTAVYIDIAANPANVRQGGVVFTHAGGNLWKWLGVVSCAGSSITTYTSGSIQLAGPLTHAQIMLNGATTFDGGTFNIRCKE